MSRKIKAQSGHTLYVEPILYNDLPKHMQKAEYIKHYPKLYVVKNWNKDGVVFMYLGAGNPDAKKEIVVWYAKGSFWSSYGATMKEAIDGAQQDGWMYA